jgi:endonuclease/exonuclease/phosphatase family metal-dependent hydrolase
MNAMYEAGHHGNAILSRFPILQTRNKDVSAHRFEQRGLLHCEIDLNGQSIEREGGGDAAGYPPAYPLRVHCFCVHFGLFGKGRRAQMQALIAHVQNEVPADAPLVIAGDFNDWRNQLSRELASELDVYDAFHLGHGKPARSFPASFPLFKLDRIYVRGFDVVECHVHGGRRMSDHAALLAQLKRK